MSVLLCAGGVVCFDESDPQEKQSPQLGSDHIETRRFDCQGPAPVELSFGESTASFRNHGFSLRIQLAVPSKGEVWYAATLAGVPMPKLTLEASKWQIQDCAPPSVELELDGLHMNSKYDLHVALMSRRVVEYRGVSVEVITSGTAQKFSDLPTLSSVWHFVRDDGSDEPYSQEDQVTLEKAWQKWDSSGSPEFLETVQCQQYKVNLRTMTQTSARKTERSVLRRSVSLAYDAPMADVCLWQQIARYRTLVAARGQLSEIDASLRWLVRFFVQ